MLPLGRRVLEKVTSVIREEMEGLGAQEVSLTALQDPEIWKATGRWDDAAVDNWFKTKLKNETEVGLAFTHEEPLTRIVSTFVHSYRDLPQYIFQFQNKFRNELRAKSGLLRGREFLMKDLYSFHVSVADLDAFYENAAAAYLRIFTKLGIGDRTYRTFASGGAFSKFSDEFQTVIDSGEDTIYLSKEKGIAVNQEVMQDDILQELGLQRDQLEEVRAIEVGNIFKLGTKYSEPLGLTFADAEGKKQPVIMGSYGIGVGRLMATVVECLADEKGMIWPKNIAPFHVHLLELNAGQDETITAAVTDTIQQLETAGIDVLHDDRDVTPGQKFADADLIGVPTRVIISAKTVAAGAHEVRDRATGNVQSLTTEQLLSYVRGI
jgi:prolyl-tRNA synthetase